MLTGHARVEARSLAMHRAIAAKLRTQPELIEVARENLRRRVAEPGRSRKYFEEWLAILKRPLAEVLAVVEDDSERMTAPRLCTPLAGIFTPKERWVIYDADL